MLKKLLFCFMLYSVNFFSQSNLAIDDENRYYKNVNTTGIIKTLIVDNPNDNSGNQDSNKLQNLINQVSNLTSNNKKGGIIKIPAGKYYFDNIIMKSNVHIKVNKNATLILGPVPDPNKNITMFVFGKDNDTKHTKNVSITCDSNNSNDKFTVNFNLSNYNSSKFITCARVENFLISGIKVYDNYTRLPVIGITNSKTNNTFYRSRQGVVKNITSLKSAYGYGLVQMHAGTNILFKNLWGEGGVVLRLEPHYRENEAGQILIHNIIARNISGRNGNATVMLSPHRLDHGFVDIRNIKSNSSGFALRIESGFSSKVYNPATGKKGKAYDNNGNEITGSFSSNSVFKNISAIYGTKAQLKDKHFKYIPCSLYNNSLLNVDENGQHITSIPTYVGPAIVAVHKRNNYTLNNISNITATGFTKQKNNGKTFYNSDSIFTCGNVNITSIQKQLETVTFNQNNNTIKVFPNPVTNSLHINNSINSVLKIYTSVGILIKEIIVTNNSYLVNTSFLKPGIYYINVSNDQTSYQQKIIKV
ncbi:hypothetical protein FHR24_002619 [Wenyingzhuangia heitensis]|uniref:Secretion system C-terminal sorting domain-containing protein n=1 Tax=Wenyingzhuangia heitensis TaxID=1487859 RepID=A0ABX0UG28_9FLAO|nr:T9SS type A sorting domain-containing protein [Wenyingzhuangia heitensis]NIJ46141.1 hypothetical protein [Wenyingzhuangia heitensis]